MLHTKFNNRKSFFHSKCVEVAEAPGFVVNKILIPMVNEAIDLVETGVASVADIDKAMMLGANHPMGPLALGDFIGPLGMLRLCRRTADALERIERMVSPLMISDVGCAATLTQSCAQAAALNVLVNAKLLKDDTVAQRLIRETQETSRQVAEILGPVYAKVPRRLPAR